MAIKNIKAIIVGGGLAGLTSALELKKRGFEVVVLEREAQIKRKVCGEYLSPLGVLIAKQLGLGLLLKNYKNIIGMNLIAPNGSLVETTFPKGHGLSLNRELFEKDLLRMVQDNGIEVKLGYRIDNIKYEKEQWHIDNMQADLLIGADGRQSMVARYLGLSKESKKKTIAIHFYLKRLQDHQRRGEMIVLGDGQYIGINPVSEVEDNISWVGPTDNLKSLGGRQKLIEEILNHPRMIELYGNNPDIDLISSVSQVSHEVKDVYAKNVVLIGDAAGFIDPLTGEGMTRAFESTQFLAKALDQSNNLQDALKNYANHKRTENRDKNRLNKLFQIFIRSKLISNTIAYLLCKSQQRANIFIGIIGNVYTPREGIRYFVAPKKMQGELQ